MSPPAFCTLCLIPVDGIVRGSHDEAPLEYPHPRWVYEFRALYSGSRGSTVASLSGPGKRNRLEDEVQPECSHTASAPAPGSEPVRLRLMRSRFDDPAQRSRIGDGEWGHWIQAWGFPFHTSCWEALRLVRPGEEVNVQVLFDICRSFPVQNNMINFGHDYGGIAKYEDSHHSTEEPRMCRDMNPAYPCDPLAVPQLRQEVEAECRDRRAKAGADLAPQTQYPITAADVFAKLPPEVLQHILEYLPTPNVVPLKQSSKTFANLPILQPFWRSRFLPGGELEYAFETRGVATQLRGRWRSLYCRISALLDADVCNRMRTWRLASGMWELMDVVNASGLRGDEDGLEALPWVAASRALRDRMCEFTHGSRDLFRRTLAVPREGVAVSVTLVEVFGRRYVSALQLGRDGSKVLGYPHELGKAVLTAVPVEVTGFYLSHDERGVRGLAVISGPGSAVSPWAGDHEGIPIRRLVFDRATASQGSVRYLKGGFDALKLVSLSISDGEPASRPFDAQPSFIDTSLWLPSVPPPDVYFLGIDPAPSLYPNPDHPVTTAIFGPDARALRRVRAIRVWRRKGYGSNISGIEVLYSHGMRPVRLGRAWEEENDDGRALVFEVDGESGEHIVAAEVTYTNTSGSFHSLKIHTSTGRDAEFPHGEPKESWVRPRQYIPRCRYTVKRLLPDGGTIIGFCARVGQWRGLKDIGIISMEQGRRLRSTTSAWEDQSKKMRRRGRGLDRELDALRADMYDPYRGRPRYCRR